MSYFEHFNAADFTIQHISKLLHSKTDSFIESRYVGFVCVSAVTAYELSIKKILIAFSKNRDSVFGNYIESIYMRLNGKIGINDLKGLHIKRFGDKYVDIFKDRLEKEQEEFLKIFKLSAIDSYNNLLTWRNEFAHTGSLKTYASLKETVESYNAGKVIIYCLDYAMK